MKTLEELQQENAALLREVADLKKVRDVDKPAEVAGLNMQIAELTTEVSDLMDLVSRIAEEAELSPELQDAISLVTEG